LRGARRRRRRARHDGGGGRRAIFGASPPRARRAAAPPPLCCRAPLLTASPPPPQIYEKSPERVKNFGVWFRYDSRTGTHNAYKEFREMSAEKAINHLYQNMAGLSRAKATAIQILKVSELAPSECKRPDIKQFHKGGIQFPLPHRVRKTEKAYKTTFKASRPNTHY
jgi:large subunit ribosomal protein L18Ae